MWLGLLFAPALAACPQAQPAAPERLVGLPFPTPGVAGYELWVPGPFTLPLHAAAPVSGNVTIHAECIAVTAEDDAPHRVLRLLALGPDEGFSRGLRDPWATLHVAVGDSSAEIALDDVTLVEGPDGWDVAVDGATSHPVALTWHASGEISYGCLAGRAEAYLLDDLDLLVPPLAHLRGSDRLALERLWSEAPELIPIDTVAGLQTARLPAAERAALGHFVYPRGDARFAGAHLYAGPHTRLLVNGREVKGRPINAAFPFDPRPRDLLDYTLPVGGVVWLRLDGQWPLEMLAVVDGASRLYAEGPEGIVADPVVGPRVVVTSPDATWTLCVGHPLVDGQCPRTVETPAHLYADAKRDGVSRYITLCPAAPGTYTLGWGADELTVSWAPSPK